MGLIKLRPPTADDCMSMWGTDTDVNGLIKSCPPEAGACKNGREGSVEAGGFTDTLTDPMG